MDINSLLTGLAAIKTYGKMLLNERDRQKFSAIQTELTDKIIEAQSQFLQLQGTVIEQQRLIPVLEQRIRELEAAVAEKASYQLTKLGSLGEFFVYTLRPGTESQESVCEIPHFLCQPCFDAGKKVVLVGNGDGYWSCPVCRHGARITPETRVSMRTGRRGISDALDDYTGTS